MSCLTCDRIPISFRLKRTHTYQFVSIFILLECYDFAPWKWFRSFHVCVCVNARAVDPWKWLTDWLVLKKTGKQAHANTHTHTLNDIILHSARMCTTICHIKKKEKENMTIICLNCNLFPIRIHFCVPSAAVLFALNHIYETYFLLFVFIQFCFFHFASFRASLVYSVFSALCVLSRLVYATGHTSHATLPDRV